MRHSRLILSFKRKKSQQLRMEPFALGTIAIPAHQSVGCSTLQMSPSFSMRFSSCDTCSVIGIGIRRGTANEYGEALSVRLILCGGSLNSPRVKNSFENSFGMSPSGAAFVVTALKLVKKA